MKQDRKKKLSLKKRILNQVFQNGTTSVNVLKTAEKARKASETCCEDACKSLDETGDINDVMNRMDEKIKILKRDVASLVLQNVKVIDQTLDLERTIKECCNLHGAKHSKSIKNRPKTIAIDQHTLSIDDLDRFQKCGSCYDPLENYVQYQSNRNYAKARKLSMRNRFLSDSLREYALRNRLIDKDEHNRYFGDSKYHIDSSQLESSPIDDVFINDESIHQDTSNTSMTNLSDHNSNRNSWDDIIFKQSEIFSSLSANLPKEIDPWDNNTGLMNVNKSGTELKKIEAEKQSATQDVSENETDHLAKNVSNYEETSITLPKRSSLSLKNSINDQNQTSSETASISSRKISTTRKVSFDNTVLINSNRKINLSKKWNQSPRTSLDSNLSIDEKEGDDYSENEENLVDAGHPNGVLGTPLGRPVSTENVNFESHSTKAMIDQVYVNIDSDSTKEMIDHEQKSNGVEDDDIANTIELKQDKIENRNSIQNLFEKKQNNVEGNSDEINDVIAVKEHQITQIDESKVKNDTSVSLKQYHSTVSLIQGSYEIERKSKNLTNSDSSITRSDIDIGVNNSQEKATNCTPGKETIRITNKNLANANTSNGMTLQCNNRHGSNDISSDQMKGLTSGKLETESDLNIISENENVGNDNNTVESHKQEMTSKECSSENVDFGDMNQQTVEIIKEKDQEEKNNLLPRNAAVADKTENVKVDINTLHNGIEADKTSANAADISTPIPFLGRRGSTPRYTPTKRRGSAGQVQSIKQRMALFENDNSIADQKVKSKSGSLNNLTKYKVNPTTKFGKVCETEDVNKVLKKQNKAEAFKTKLNLADQKRTQLPSTNGLGSLTRPSLNILSNSETVLGARKALKGDKKPNVPPKPTIKKDKDNINPPIINEPSNDEKIKTKTDKKRTAMITQNASVVENELKQVESSNHGESLAARKTSTTIISDSLIISVQLANCENKFCIAEAKVEEIRKGTSDNRNASEIGIDTFKKPSVIGVSQECCLSAKNTCIHQNEVPAPSSLAKPPLSTLNSTTDVPRRTMRRYDGKSVLGKRGPKKVNFRNNFQN